MSNGEMGYEKRSHQSRFWKIFGGAMMLAVVAGVVASFGDIRRYIKISTM
ncbi:MAG TPA: hypothetical protein VIV66_18945 [Pyrinomonadaceae bacterium]